jgi:hypothetical protein
MFDKHTSLFLTAGAWRWQYRNKETLAHISSYNYIKLEKNLTHLCFIPPIEVKENKLAMLYVERSR